MWKIEKQTFQFVFENFKYEDKVIIRIVLEKITMNKKNELKKKLNVVLL